MAGVIAILVLYAAITTTVVPGVAALYPATAFEVTFGIWFGVWGAIASYLGLLIAGTYAGWFSLPIGMVLSVSDFLAAFIPALLFRALKVQPSLKTPRDWAVYIVAGVILSSLPGSLYYNYINLLLGYLPGMEAFWVGVISWNIGNYVVVLIISTILLKSVSGYVMKAGLYVKGLVR